MDLKALLTSKKESKFKSLIIAAHFDDETVGLGARLPYLGEIFFIHTTDSSPLDLQDAIRNGFDNAEDYYLQRKKELTDAVNLAGIQEFVCYGTGVHDQQAIFNLGPIVDFIVEKIKSVKPEVIFTHPYEGGHPDHDSTSFAVNHAAAKCGFSNVIEFTSYNSDGGYIKTGSFLPSANPVTELFLSDEERQLKTRMLEAFVTQKGLLQYFKPDKELFREAPQYDYSKPPHEGKLFYDNYNWGVKSDEWLRIANEYS